MGMIGEDIIYAKLTWESPAFFTLLGSPMISLLMWMCTTAWAAKGLDLIQLSHPSTLSEGVLFLPMGAKTLDPEDTAEFLLVTSIPAFRKEHQHDLAVLKMDCEGCEYSIARDVELGDRTFWFHVQQFAVEIHVSKRWVKTDAHIYYLALLFHQLEEAGLVLSGGEQTSCSPSDESLGCPELLLEVDFPCQPKGMCLNFFFARV